MSIAAPCRRVTMSLVLALAMLSLTGAPASAGTQANPYGAISAINGFSLSKLPASQWGPQMAAMSAQGIQLVRSDADWGTIEPEPPGVHGPAWQFASTDAWVTALALHHLTWQPILDYDNSWATAVGHDGAFAAFGQAVAQRYGVGGSFWAANPALPYEPVRIVEVWNEENGQPWYISPADYGPLYAATRAAIHQVDQQVSVDVGGLSDDSGDFDPSLDYPSWYVIRMFGYDPGLEGNIDGFALHPYGTTATDAAEWLVEFRKVLTQFSEGTVPIDITEFGWVVGAGTAAENWRAAQMNALGLAFARSNCGIREVAPYDWINPTALAEPGDFGFVGRDGESTTLRPAATAWFAAFARAGGMSQFDICPAAPSAPTPTPGLTSGASPAPPAAAAAPQALPTAALNAVARRLRSRLLGRHRVRRRHRAGRHRVHRRARRPAHRPHR